MKIQIIYASLTGCTRKLAQAIYNSLPAADTTLHDLKDGVPVLDGDIILAGYWGISGGPSEDVRAFLETISGKAVGIFCTLGYYAGTEHAFKTVQAGVDLVKDKNEVIGAFSANGAVAQSLKEGQGLGQARTPTQQKELRWEMTKDHPSPAECALAAERFGERIQLYTRCKALGIPFQSIM